MLSPFPTLASADAQDRRTSLADLGMLGRRLVVMGLATLFAALGCSPDPGQTPADLDLEYRVRAATLQLSTVLTRVAVGAAPVAELEPAPLSAWGVVIDAESGYIVANHHVVGMVDTLTVLDADGLPLGRAHRVGSSECHDLALARFEADPALDTPEQQAFELSAELDWYVDLIRPDLSLLVTDVLRPSTERSASAIQVWDGPALLGGLGDGQPGVDGLESRFVIRTAPDRIGSSLAAVEQGITSAPAGSELHGELESSLQRSSGPIIAAADHSIVGIAYASSLNGTGDGAGDGIGDGTGGPARRRKTHAVAANEASAVIQRLVAGEPGLGMGIAPRTWLPAETGTPTPRGVWVEAVRAGSPADLLGLRPGDLITRIGEYALDDPNSPENYSLRGYCSALATHRIGPSQEPIPLEIVRNPVAERGSVSMPAGRGRVAQRCAGRLHATPLTLVSGDSTQAQTQADDVACP